MYQMVSFQHCEQDLKNCYHDATRKGGLLEFTRKIRTPANDLSGKYSVSTQDLSKLFSETVWRECKQSSGHRKLVNIVTGVKVEYPSHNNKGGIDPGVAETLLDTIEEHLNFLSDKVFAYITHNWKSEPDYASSVKRLITL